MTYGTESQPPGRFERLQGKDLSRLVDELWGAGAELAAEHNDVDWHVDDHGDHGDHGDSPGHLLPRFETLLAQLEEVLVLRETQMASAIVRKVREGLEDVDGRLSSYETRLSDLETTIAGLERGRRKAGA